MEATRRFAAIALSAGLCLAATFALEGCHSRAAGQMQGWPIYGGQPAQDHYSPLSQINRGNVNKLAVAWKYDTGQRGQLECNPIVVGHVLYTDTPEPGVIALDAATGKLLWQFRAPIQGRAVTRGVSYWSDGHDSRIFAGFRNYLLALDANTGKLIPSFGEDGRIDLRKGLREPYQQQSITLTSPVVSQKRVARGGGLEK